MEMKDFLEVVERLVKQHSSIDFRETLSIDPDDVETDAVLGETIYVIKIFLPSSCGSILLGPLLLSLKDYGAVQDPILFRDPGTSYVEILGKSSGYSYKIWLVTDERTM